MADRSPLDYTEEIHIKYDGLLANQNIIPVEDLTESLQGWQSFFDLEQLARSFSIGDTEAF
ncbi:MAG: hypothetical protein KTR15_04495 [Phycisphaeraceae bacterium]|nr:hypothetical protein [Phycisphaeraceae bacterium]